MLTFQQNTDKMTYKIQLLPPTADLENKKILKKAIAANQTLAELKGVAKTIPNETILINTLPMQESKDSSEIEQIITTHDELFQFDAKNPDNFSPATKEVQNYLEALFFGFQEVKNKGFISSNLLIQIFRIITGRDQQFRSTVGTTLKNISGEVIYTPPQSEKEIKELMSNLEKFINDSSFSDLDPLVKMAIIHHQFESIHPFYDGNGRTGRILNILYLVSSGSLDLPILYLSRYFIKNKKTYYELIQKTRDEKNWEEWVLFVLTGIEETAKDTIEKIKSIKKLMIQQKAIIREKEPRIYSHELIDTIFSHPYTKIEFIMNAEKVSRQTASKHLQKLIELGLLELKKHKKTNYYLNTELLKILTKI